MIDFDEIEYVRLTKELIQLKDKQKCSSHISTREFYADWQKTYKDYLKFIELTFEPLPPRFTQYL